MIMKRILFLFASFLSLLPMRAQVGSTFSAPNADGVTLYYQIISESPHEVGIQKPTDGTYYMASEINIPAEVVNPDNGLSYTVTEVMGYAFENSSNLLRINFPATIMKFGTRMFEGAHIPDFNFPEGLRTISPRCFYGVKVQTPEAARDTVRLPASLTSSSSGFIYANFSLSDGYVLDLRACTAITHISLNCFLSSNLTGILLPETVKYIDSDAFSGNSIDTLVIPPLCRGSSPPFPRS